jgi:hypothetical protein
MVTGKHELNIEELEDKFGLMAASSKCCASGTCDAPTIGGYVGGDVDGDNKAINYEDDDTDAEILMSQYGPLA